MNHRVQVRAAQDHALRDSLAGSSMSALTLVVATMLASVLMARPTRVLVLPDSPWDPPVRGDTVYVAATDISVAVPLSDVFRVLATEQDILVPPLDAPPPVVAGAGEGAHDGRGDPALVGVDGPGTVAPPEVIPPPQDYIPHDEIPVIVHRVVPQYPGIAMNAGIEGRVMIQIYVGLDGRVHRAEVVGGGTIFDEAALEAVRRWVFTPAKANGHPVAVWMAVPLVFRLH